MPHREPFLFVDRVVEVTDSCIKTEKQIQADEPFFAGHFPGRPIMPGVLICEAVFQSSSILMSRRAKAPSNDGRIPLITRIENVKLKRVVLPGDLMEVEVKLKEILGQAAYMSGKVKVVGETVLTVEFSNASNGDGVSFLSLEDKNILVTGVANKKSVAFHIGETLQKEGANVLYSVRTEERKKQLEKLLAPSPVYVCDVENEDEIKILQKLVSNEIDVLHGLVHSIAFANYTNGLKPFHETSKNDFLQSVDITCYSLIQLSNAFKDLFDTNASVVTISISTTSMAAENYGYMAPAKAALDSSLCFLAKSFSAFSKVRFNSVNPGLLKTSASAGIPGYVDSYLHAEELTLRKEALTTQEVANCAVFLLGECSSGINAQGVVLDAGMAINYFDKDIVRKSRRLD